MPQPHVEFWAAIALLPLLFFASALSRGRPAPKLRSPFAPYVLLCSCGLAVALSGGLASPLFGTLGLLTLSVAVFSNPRHAVAIAAILSLAASLMSRLQDPLASLPMAQLVLIWGGLVLGYFISIFRRGSEASPSRAEDAQQASKGRAPSKAQAPRVNDSAVEVDTSALVDKNSASLLDLAFHAHPQWNAALLLWKEGAQLQYKGQGRAREGALKAAFTLGEGEGLLGWCLRERKRVQVADLAASTAATLPYYDGDAKAKALLATPFFDEGELLGVLVVDRSQVGEWSGDEMQSAESLGHQLVQQSQQAAFIGRVQDERKELSELDGISRELMDDLDRDLLIRRIPELLRRLLPFDAFYLALRDPEGEFAVLASEGYAPSHAAEFKLEEETELGGWLLTEGEPLIFNASQSGAIVPPFLSQGLLQSAGAHMLLPLMRSKRVFGLLKLDRQGSQAFGEAEKKAAMIFASQAAVTLEHARLYTLNKRMATTDGLTGLYNHRYFQERLATEIEKSKRTGKPLSLALTDIDLFKKFNDTFGHQEGDNVLRKCAKLLAESVRQGKDIVCRYGGEEFVVIMPDCDLVEAREVVEGMRQTCADTLRGGHGPEARAITLSIGICSHPLGAQEQRDLIHKADEALYKAKQTGRNRTCSHKDLP
jgi:two-component system cell cycle response regulator